MRSRYLFVSAASVHSVEVVCDEVLSIVVHLLEDLNVEVLLAVLRVVAGQRHICDVFIVVCQRHDHLCVLDDLQLESFSCKFAALFCGSCQLPVEADSPLCKFSFNSLVALDPEFCCSQDASVLLVSVSCQPFLCPVGFVFSAFDEDACLVVEQKVSPVLAELLCHAHLLSLYLCSVVLHVPDPVVVEVRNVSPPPVFPQMDVCVVLLDGIADRVSQVT